MALQHLRSSTAHKRPIPTAMSAGQIAVNTNEGSPGLFFKDSNGDLVKVGPVHIGTTAPNSSPDSVAATALVTGTVYQILTVGNSDFTLVGASANTVGTVFTATGTTTGTGTVSGQQGNEKGEQWLDTTGSAFDLKIYDGTAWRSQAGEFVNVTGDTMTGAFGVVAGTASAPGVFFSGDTNTGLLSPGADSVALTTGGTQRVVVDSSGNVGIGATPEEILHIAAASETVDSRDGVMLQSTSSLAADTGLPIVFTSHVGSVANYGVAAIAGRKENATSGNAAGYLQFATGNSAGAVSEKMRIDSSGNVGIGTASPYTVSAAGNNLNIANTSSSAEINFLSSTTGFNALYFGDGSSGSDRYRGYLEYAHNGDYMRFATATVERMRINSSGNVGIGTTSPTSSLEVHSGGSSNIIAKSTNGNGGYLNYTGLASNGTTTFSVNHNGSAYFAGIVDIDEYIELGGRGGSNGVFLVKDVNNSNAVSCTINANGSASFLGNVSANLFDAYRPTTTAGAELAVFHSDIGGSKTRRIGFLADGSAQFKGGVTADFFTRANAAGTQAGCGIVFVPTTMVPCTGSSSASTNGVMDIGSSTQQFKDAYFSGTVRAGSYLNPNANAGSSSGYGSLLGIGTSINSTKFATNRIQAQSGAATDRKAFEVYYGTSLVTNFTYAGNATFSGSVTASNVSDVRFKENITDARPQLADAVALGSQLKNFDWNDDAPLNDELRAKRFLGLVAQEAEKVCPGLTYTVPRTKQGKELTPETTDEEGNVTPATYEELDDSYKAINHDILVMKLLGAVAELSAKVAALEAG